MHPTPPTRDPDGSTPNTVHCEKCGGVRVGIQTFSPANVIPDGKGGAMPAVSQAALFSPSARAVLTAQPLAYCANCEDKTNLVTPSKLDPRLKS